MQKKKTRPLARKGRVCGSIIPVSTGGRIVQGTVLTTNLANFLVTPVGSV